MTRTVMSLAATTPENVPISTRQWAPRGWRTGVKASLGFHRSCRGLPAALRGIRGRVGHRNGRSVGRRRLVTGALLFYIFSLLGGTFRI